MRRRRRGRGRAPADAVASGQAPSRTPAGGQAPAPTAPGRRQRAGGRRRAPAHRPPARRPPASPLPTRRGPPGRRRPPPPGPRSPTQPRRGARPAPAARRRRGRRGCAGRRAAPAAPPPAAGRTRGPRYSPRAVLGGRHHLQHLHLCAPADHVLRRPEPGSRRVPVEGVAEAGPRVPVRDLVGAEHLVGDPLPVGGRHAVTERRGDTGPPSWVGVGAGPEEVGSRTFRTANLRLGAVLAAPGLAREAAAGGAPVVAREA